MQFKLKGLLKGLRYIFGRKDDEEEEEEEEEEIRIGGPTDVKHVAHIGWDGPAATPPAWMDEFHGDESGNLETGKPGGSEDQSSSSQQQVSSKGNKQGRRRKDNTTTKKQRSSNNNNNNNEGDVQVAGSKPKKAARKKKPKEDQGSDPLSDKRNTSSSFED